MNPDDIQKELQKLKDMGAQPVIDKRLSRAEVRRMTDAAKRKEKRQSTRPAWRLSAEPKEIVLCMGMKNVTHFIKGTIKSGKMSTNEETGTFAIEGTFNAGDHFIVDRESSGKPGDSRTGIVDKEPEKS